MAFTNHKDIAARVAHKNRQDVGAQDLRRIALRHNHSNNDDFKDDFCNESFSSPSCDLKLPSTVFCNEKASSSFVAPEKNARCMILI